MLKVQVYGFINFIKLKILLCYIQKHFLHKNYFSNWVVHLPPNSDTPRLLNQTVSILKLLPKSLSSNEIIKCNDEILQVMLKIHFTQKLLVNFFPPFCFDFVILVLIRFTESSRRERRYANRVTRLRYARANRAHSSKKMAGDAAEAAKNGRIECAINLSKANLNRNPHVKYVCTVKPRYMQHAYKQSLLLRHRF